MYRLLPGNPASHLREGISMIGRTPALLGVLDVQAFEHLSVVVVRRAEPVDAGNVVPKRVNFRNVEVRTNLDFDEDGLVSLPKIKRFFHVAKSLSCVCGVLRKVDEVEDGTNCSQRVFR